MHQERKAVFEALLIGMVPIWGLSWAVLGGPPTGIVAVVLAGIAFALGYVVLNAFGQFYTLGRRICPYCRKRISAQAVACHRCGRVWAARSPGQ